MGRHDNMRNYASLTTTSYCRISNIYFNRAITVPPPPIDLPLLVHYQTKLSNSRAIESYPTPVRLANQRQSNNNNEDSLESILEPCVTKQNTKALLYQLHYRHDPTLGIQQQNLTDQNHIKQSCTDSDYRSNSFDSTQTSSSDLVQINYPGCKHTNDNNCAELCDALSRIKSETNSDTPRNKNKHSSEQPIVDVDYARGKLIAKVDKHLFWSSKAAKNVQIYSIEQKLVYICTLESFTEKRLIQWQYEPYHHKWARPALSKTDNDGQREPTRETIWSDLTGQPVSPAEGLDQGNNKPAMRMFQSSIFTKELPNTSFIKTCHICQGRARKNCGNCNKLGYEVCYACLGKGQGTKRSYSSHQWSSSDQRTASRSSSRSSQDLRYASSNRRSSFDLTSSDTCHHCHGGGKRRCPKCKGAGYNICKGCEGQAQVRCYMKLSVVLNNHKEETIINNDNETIIPNDRLKLASGCTIYEQVAPKLKQIECAGHDPGVAPASEQMLEKHQSTYKDELLLQQRQKVYSIEVNVVKYGWKNKFGHFVIYGDERKAYVPKFPYKNLCSIS